MKKDKKSKYEVGLQSAMMTDLVFTLFIFFILVSTLRKDSVQIKTPKTEVQKVAKSQNKNSEQHVITMDSKNQIFVDGKLVPDGNLRSVLEEIKRKLPADTTPTILLRPDASALAFRLIEVGTLLYSLGFENLECEVEKK